MTTHQLSDLPSVTLDHSDLADRTTARSVLVDSGVDIGGSLIAREALDRSKARLTQADASFWKEAYGQLTELVETFLTVDLSLVLLLGLSRTQELVDAAWSTRNSDNRVVVQLSGRTFTLRQRPSVDLMMGQARMSTVNFELQVSLTANALSAVVVGGRLAGFTSGSLEATVSLACDGVELAKSERAFDPALQLDLGAGWPLLPDLATGAVVTDPGADPRRSSFVASETQFPV
jgi:hypothetical protein